MRKNDSPMPEKTGLPKSSIPFVVMTIVAVMIGGWLYVEIVRIDLQTQVDLLRRTQPSVSREGGSKVMEDTVSDAVDMMYSQRIGSTELVRFNYPKAWRVDREGDGLTGFYDAKEELIAQISCSEQVEDIGGHTIGAEVTSIDIPRGGDNVNHYKIKKYPDSDWLVFIENEQQYGNSCILTFMKDRLDEATYEYVVDSVTVAKD